AAANDDEIAARPWLQRLSRRPPEPRVAQRVRHVVRAIVAAAHPGERRWVVAGGVLREAGGRLQVEAGEPGARHQTGRADRDAVQEIAPRDDAIHPELSIARRMWFVSVRAQCDLRPASCPREWCAASPE